MFKFEKLESNIMTIQEMAIQGDTESQYELGFCYKEGIGYHMFSQVISR